MNQNSKKGVSLITLIITIIVMIILAGAIILTLSRTNTIGKANEAKFKQTVATYQDELNNYLAERFLENPFFSPTGVNYTGDNMKVAIPSMRDTDTEIFEIKNGKLVIKGTADDDYKDWAQDVGIDVVGGSPASSSATSSPAPSSAPSSSASPSVAPSAAPTTAAPINYIDGTPMSVIKASIKADTRPGITVSGSASVSTGTRVAQQYYGKTVNYSANGISDWQLFYIGESGPDGNKEYNVYLISTNSIPYDKLPGYDGTSAELKQMAGRVIFNDNSNLTTIKADNKMVTRGYVPTADLNQFGLNVTTTNASGEYSPKPTGIHNSIKAMLYLLNETKWSAFASGTGAEVAYGGVTLRMFILAYNEYFNTTSVLSLGSGATAYQIDSLPTFIFKARTDQNVFYDDTKNYWTAGPLGDDGTSLGRVAPSGTLRMLTNCDSREQGSDKGANIRVLVSLSGSTSLRSHGDGTYDIVS